MILNQRFADIIRSDTVIKEDSTEGMTQDEIVDKIWSGIGG